MSKRKKHPKRDIEAAVQHAEKFGWTIKTGGGHAWGQMLCPYNDRECRCGDFCRVSINSTPKSPTAHARQLRRVVDNCQRNREQIDE